MTILQQVMTMTSHQQLYLPGVRWVTVQKVNIVTVKFVATMSNILLTEGSHDCMYEAEITDSDELKLLLLFYGP